MTALDLLAIGIGGFAGWSFLRTDRPALHGLLIADPRGHSALPLSSFPFGIDRFVLLGGLLAVIAAFVICRRERTVLICDRSALRAERDRLDAAFRRADERLGDFAQSATDWLWEMDSALRFSHLSERFTDVTGLPKETLLGKTREETGNPGIEPAV